MATFYVLYSSSLNKFYVGSCKELEKRVEQHNSKLFPGAFTGKANDWVVYSLEKCQLRSSEKNRIARKEDEKQKISPETKGTILKFSKD